ncbi:uncharacterized protein METZ01_LOCUS390540, partial [marine metagenome]
EKIQTRRFFAPMSYQPIFEYMKGRIAGSVDVSENISARGLYLPTFVGMENDLIQEVSNKINFFLKNNS